MKLPRKTTIRGLIAAAVLSIAVTGIAFALTQIERPVPASVSVELVAPNGIEIYLDEDLTQIADFIDFDALNVDVFGTVHAQEAVPVWIENQSFSTVGLSLGDDFEDADVVFDGDGSPVLGAGSVLAAELLLHFDGEPGEGESNFTVFFRADGPLEDVPPTPTGSIVIAVLSVDVASGLPATCTAGCSETIYMSGITETLFNSKENPDGTVGIEPMLATEFTLDQSLEFGEFTLRDDVMFHDGWGLMTADDVAFSYNNANSVTNPNSLHGQAGDFAPLIQNMEAINPTTVRLNYRNYDSRGVLHRFNRFWQTAGIVSESVFDEYGDDMEDVIVGVGAFSVDEWASFENIQLTAFPDYYARGEGNIGPFVENVRWVHVSESSSRRALLETGEVQIADVTLKDVPALVNSGFETQKGALFNTVDNISFTGNYWEQFSALTGEELVRDRDTSKPWVGNPFEDGDEYDETTTSMQSSRLVRNAFAWSIPREDMVDDFLSGLGIVNHQPYLSQTNPNYRDEWGWGTDYVEGAQLMAEAGYEDGFEMDLWVGLTELNAEIGEAVSTSWQQNLGVDVNLIKTAYSTYRPGLVARTTNTPFLGCGDENKSNFPFDWAHGFVMSSISSGGYGVGVEVPFASETYLEMAGEPDKANREALAETFYENNREEALCVGIFERPLWPVFNPDTIASWDMRPTANGNLGGINNVRTIKRAP